MIPIGDVLLGYVVAGKNVVHTMSMLEIYLVIYLA
jgi:hypothetical protein